MTRLRVALLCILASLAAAAPAGAQTSPNWTYGQVPTVAQWNAVFAGKQDYLGAQPLLTTGGTMVGPLVTAASITSAAGFNVPAGTAPTTPNNGDIWTTTAGLFVRINGATVGPLTGAVSASFAATSPVTVSFPAGVVTYAWNFSVANTWLAQQTGQGATTTQPGWYATISGDVSPRVHVGLSATDTPTLSFGPGSGTRDTFLQRSAAATFRLGADDAASPIAQTIGVQNVVAGTTNAAGSNLTINGSRGTGTGAGGAIVFQIAPAGLTGSSQNALVNAASIAGDGGLILNGATSGGLGSISAVNNQNAATQFQITNTSTGTAAFAQVSMVSATGIAAFGAGGPNETSTPALAGKGYAFSSVGGFVVYAAGTNPIDFYVNAARIGGFTSAGVWSTGAELVTSASATCLVVGPNGTTNPVLTVDCSQAGQENGIKITGFGGGSGTALAVTSADANDGLSINAKGTSAVLVGNISTGGVSIGSGGGGVIIGSAMTYGGVTLSNAVTGTGSMVLATSPSIATPTVTGSFTATGLVTFADMATAAVATTAQYFAGTASTLVPASVIYTAVMAVTFGATTTFDFSTFINAAVTMTGNITTQTLSNVKAGQAGTIFFVQDATGSRTTVWNSIFKFTGGVTPTLSTAANAVDALEYSCTSATFCIASLIKDVR
jgi:hypothetical protein